MKTLGLYGLVVSLASLAATVQPAAEPVAQTAQVHAALADMGERANTQAATSCQSAACRSGWQAASNNAIYDAADCREVSEAQGEVEGCKAYVDAVLQARLENQW